MQRARMSLSSSAVTSNTIGYSQLVEGWKGLVHKPFADEQRRRPSD